MEKIAHYCQKCRAANETGEANCWNCGTRLMIVVFPPSVRHEDSITPSYYEDHLLERVSLLELRLSQVMKQLGMAYEFIRRETESFQNDHALLQSFFETLEKVNPDFSHLLSRDTIELYDEKVRNLAVKKENDDELNLILAEHDNKKAELFTHLVKEGIRLLKENEEKQAFSNLDRAVLLSPKNVSLLLFIAKNQYDSDKFEKAKENLEKAFEISPQNTKVLLLLGAIYADQGEGERARKLLSVLANDPKTSVCVNFIWGFLAASEENWTESLAAFKECLGEEEIPEINYLLGCVWRQLGNEKNALTHLTKAVESDIRFADAWFVKSLIYKNLKKEVKQNQARQAAFESKEAGAQCLEFLKGKKDKEPEIALPFQHLKRSDRGLLTGGSLRLNKFLRERIFKAFE